MRDITKDLIERLDSIESERLKLNRRIAELEKDEVVVKSMLEREQGRSGRMQPDLFESRTMPDEEANGKYATPLARAVIGALLRVDSAPLAELKKYVERQGIEFGDKSPGRAIHILLMGMRQNGLAERTAEGEWRLIESKEQRKGEH